MDNTHMDQVCVCVCRPATQAWLARRPASGLRCLAPGIISLTSPPLALAFPRAAHSPGQMSLGGSTDMLANAEATVRPLG